MAPVIFTHVPKTAGASIEAAVLSVVPAGRTHIVKKDDDDVSELLPIAEQLDFVGGHIRFPIARAIFADGIYVGSARNPLHRLLSHYFYVRRHRGAGPEILDSPAREGFEVFYHQVVRHSGRTNAQCGYYADDRTFAAARAVIKAEYALVWSMERTRDAWPIVHSLLQRPDLDRPFAIAAGGRPDVPAMDDVHIAPIASDEHAHDAGSRPADYDGYLDTARAAEIIAENAEDARLSDWLDSLGGLFVNPRFISFMA